MSDHDHLRVTFYTEPVEDPVATRKEGRPIFKDEEFVFILIGGDPKSTLRAPAHASVDRDKATGQPRTYAQKFPEEYRFFKANEDQHQSSGTPLTEVPWLTAARREELKALKIFTVETLAGLDGTNLQRIGMGARELKNKAQAWLDAASGVAVEGKLASELAARDEQIEAMQRQIAEMSAMIGKFDRDRDGKPGGSLPQDPVVDEEPDTTGSPFANWGAEDLKNWIKDATGARPQGNPSIKTLIARADEINAELAAQKAA
jgi:hypothetical protein